MSEALYLPCGPCEHLRVTAPETLKGARINGEPVVIYGQHWWPCGGFIVFKVLDNFHDPVAHCAECSESVKLDVASEHVEWMEQFFIDVESR